MTKFDTIAQIYLKESELRFRAGSNPAGRVPEVCDDENVRLKHNTFSLVTIPQKNNNSYYHH